MNELILGQKSARPSFVLLDGLRQAVSRIPRLNEGTLPDEQSCSGTSMPDQATIDAGSQSKLWQEVLAILARYEEMPKDGVVPWFDVRVAAREAEVTETSEVLGYEIEVLRQLRRVRSLDRFQIGGMSGLPPSKVAAALTLLERQNLVERKTVDGTPRYSMISR
jgi:hypothetical protein